MIYVLPFNALKNTFIIDIFTKKLSHLNFLEKYALFQKTEILCN